MANVVQYILDIKSGKAQKGLKKMGDSADRAEKKLKRVRKSGLQMASQLGNAVTGVAAGIGLTVAAFGTMFRAIQNVATGVKDLTTEVVDSVNNLNDLNAQTGLTAGTIQALGAAFMASGQEASKATAFVTRWPKIYSDIATEGTKAAESARQLGIEVRNSDGSMKSSDELLQNITRSLQAVSDDTQRATAAFAILGRAGGEFLQALGKTTAFDNFLALTEKFGVQTTPEASRAAAEFQASLSAVDVVTQGLKQRFVDATGGVVLFNKGLRQAIVVAVTLQEIIENNRESFQMLGEGMAQLAAFTFEVFRDITYAFAVMLDGFVRQQVGAFTALTLIMRELGVISEQTSQKALAGITGALKFTTASVDIAGKLQEADFSSGTERSQEALKSLDDILAGLEQDIKKTNFSLNDLSKGIEQTGESAESANKMVRSEAEKAYDQQLQNTDNFIAATERAFDTMNLSPLERQMYELDQTVERLEQAFEFLEENGLSTIKVEKLLAKAREEQTRVMLEGVEVTKKATIEFDNLLQGFATGIDAVQSPEQLLRTLPNAMKAAPAMAEAAGLGASGLAAAGAAASAAPVVGALGAIAIALAKLGETTEKEVNEKFDSFISNFEKGIDLLPTILMKVLPEFIAQLTKIMLIDLSKLLMIDLPLALIAAIPILIVEIVQEVILLIADIYKGIVLTIEGITNFIDRLKTDGIRGIIDALKEALRGLMTDMKDWIVDAFSMRSGGRFIPQAAGGIRFTGSESGLALLHRGETVVPESNVTTQAVNRRLNRSGGGMNIIINADIIEGSAVDSLVRKIEERFGEFGASTSTLFGGT
jgi:hypothetical protein